MLENVFQERKKNMLIKSLITQLKTANYEIKWKISRLIN